MVPLIEPPSWLSAAHGIPNISSYMLAGFRLCSSCPSPRPFFLLSLHCDLTRNWAFVEEEQVLPSTSRVMNFAHCNIIRSSMKRRKSVSTRDCIVAGQVDSSQRLREQKMNYLFAYVLVH
ncbi:uncharacterized protein LOC126790101 [Argentina anserina]|uniref:uncharacterized protein LOC126790101 n=1 Tax=Argentina anserina TaxID=57926 RepID=UPI002176698E|nr:uncharacterized protein LOC126790101 [Potentilla anserina]